ncbi:MAG: hypothetical protein JWR19_35 [Pedosphaera sp.]|nr:hypothetical protein [Pedosphaera sp.]
MSKELFKFSMVCVLLIASVVTPLVVRHSNQEILQEKEEALRQQAEQLAQFRAEKEHAASVKLARSFSEAQLAELLRLRSEAGKLRQQMKAMQGLREENQRLEDGAAAVQPEKVQMSSEEFADKVSPEIMEAMKTIIQELPAAWQRFANDRTNEVPTLMPAQFSELRKYFPAPGGQIMAGLRSVEFVRDGGPVPGDALFLREERPRKGADGKWRRVYAFTDGRVLEATVDDSEFGQWERQYLGAPAPAGR